MVRILRVMCPFIKVEWRVQMVYVEELACKNLFLTHSLEEQLRFRVVEQAPPLSWPNGNLTYQKWHLHRPMCNNSFQVFERNNTSNYNLTGTELSLLVFTKLNMVWCEAEWLAKSTFCLQFLIWGQPTWSIQNPGLIWLSKLTNNTYRRYTTLLFTRQNPRIQLYI